MMMTGSPSWIEWEGCFCWGFRDSRHPRVWCLGLGEKSRSRKVPLSPSPPLSLLRWPQGAEWRGVLPVVTAEAHLYHPPRTQTPRRICTDWPSESPLSPSLAHITLRLPLLLDCSLFSPPEHRNTQGVPQDHPFLLKVAWSCKT